MAAAKAGGGSTTGDEEHARSFSDYHWSGFVALEARVTIVPRFTMGRIPCIGGHYGPFSPNYPVDVPLWLALHLRQTDTCTINVPDFMRVPALQRMLELERLNANVFEPLPFHCFEIAKRILEHAADDVPSVMEVMRLLEEIKYVRQAKLVTSMAVFEADGAPLIIPGIKVWNLVSTELHHLRNSFSPVVAQAVRMDQQRQPPAGMPPVLTSSGLGETSGRPSGADGLSQLTQSSRTMSDSMTVSEAHRGTYGRTSGAAADELSVGGSVWGNLTSVDGDGGDQTNVSQATEGDPRWPHVTSTDGERPGTVPASRPSSLVTVEAETDASVRHHRDDEGPAQPVIKKRRTLRQS